MKRPNEKDYSPDNQIFFHEERQRYYAELEKYIDYLEEQLKIMGNSVELFYCNDELVNNAIEEYDEPRCDVQCDKCKEWEETNVPKETKLISAFCGTGKTHICNQTDINAIEIEYWKYKEEGLKKEYLQDIKNQIGKVDYIFISTEPDGLQLLNREGYDITLIYPENELRDEYLDRYIERDSPYDFIGTFMKHWHIWINELKEQYYCKHIVLKRGEYLANYLEVNKDGITFPCNSCNIPFDTAELESVGEMTKDGEKQYTLCTPCADKWFYKWFNGFETAESADRELKGIKRHIAKYKKLGIETEMGFRGCFKIIKGK